MIDGVSIKSGADAPNWKSNPVNRAWIIEGSPTARTAFLSASADGTANSFYWDCTAGRFNWIYTFDETLYILEGSALLKFRDGTSRRIVAGDSVFFPVGSRAEWTVDTYIRKIAFCRSPWPTPVVKLRQLLRWSKRLGRRGPSGAVDAPAAFPSD
jgi:uncharacterized cupin superfamily protein